jgi:hypothetical protein
MGRSRLKSFIGLLVFVALLVAALRIIPVYVEAYAFRDEMRTQARMFPSAYPVRTTDQVAKDLQAKAESLGLSIRRDQIQVATTPEGIRVTSRFTVRVDLIVVERNFPFSFSTSTQEAMGD